MMFMSFNSDTTGATGGAKTAYPSRVVIGTDCIGSCKSNYHMIMTTTAPVMYTDQMFTSISCFADLFFMLPFFY